MARLNVNPTRVELRNLTQRLSVAKRGHTLLKEKQDAMIRRFLKLAEEARHDRKELEEKMTRIYQSYQRASVLNDERVLQKVLNSAEDLLEVDMHLDYLLGVKVPQFRLPQLKEVQPVTSGFLALRDLDEIQRLKKEVQLELVSLAATEKQCQMLAHEIKLTKRRVNSLEFRTIPNLEETIRYIDMKIEDTERNQIAKLIQLQ